MESVSCLVGARDLLREDPIGVLLPAAALLLLDAGMLGLVYRVVALDPLHPGALVAATLVGAFAFRLVASAALRSRLIAQGARANGFVVGAWGRPAAMLGVQLIVGPLTAFAALMFAVPVAVVAVMLSARGWFGTGVVLLGAAVVAGGLGALVVRSVFALAPAEVIVGQRSAVGAVRRCLAAGGKAALGSAVLVLAGDAAVAAGGLLCAALALPGYPVGDLALLVRYCRREGL